MASFRARDRFNQKALFFTEARVRPSDFATVSMSTSASAKQRKGRTSSSVHRKWVFLAVICYSVRGRTVAGRWLPRLQPLHCACLGAVICFWLSDRPYGAVPCWLTFDVVSLVFFADHFIGSVGRTGDSGSGTASLARATNCEQGQQHPHIVFWRLIINIWREFPRGSAPGDRPTSTERIYHPAERCMLPVLHLDQRSKRPAR